MAVLSSIFRRNRGVLVSKLDREGDETVVVGISKTKGLHVYVERT